MRANQSLSIGDAMETTAASAHSYTFNAMFHIVRRNLNPPSILIWGLLFALTYGATPHQAVLDDLRGQEVNNNTLGAVASENKVCSQIGIDLLKAGGNAADAVGLAFRLCRCYANEIGSSLARCFVLASQARSSPPVIGGA